MSSNSLPLLAVTFILAAATGCESGRHSSAGFRLPADGDPARGQVAFAKFECNSCHEVGDMTPAQSTTGKPGMLKIGGKVAHEIPDGYLVTSIINPSYKLARYSKEPVSQGGESRMPNYAAKITVQELTDLVAFLQSQYTVEQPVPRYHF